MRQRSFFLKAGLTCEGLVMNSHPKTQLDGVEVARLVRDRWLWISVILMSSHSDPSSGPVPEGTEFIAKPFLFEHLVPTLTRLIRRRIEP